MTKKKTLKPIVGQHLLSFPENSPAPYELFVHDGHYLLLSDPSGDSKLISKYMFLITLKRLFENGHSPNNN